MSENNLKVSMDYDAPSAPHEQEEITPFGVISAMAAKIGQHVHEPNSSCKKCQGRGYIGRDHTTKAPIPCMCIYDSYDKQQNMKISDQLRPLSRSERRKQKRAYDKMIKSAKKKEL